MAFIICKGESGFVYGYFDEFSYAYAYFCAFGTRKGVTGSGRIEDREREDESAKTVHTMNSGKGE